MFNLAITYAVGDGVEQDKAKAEHWGQEALGSGYAPAYLPASYPDVWWQIMQQTKLRAPAHLAELHRVVRNLLSKGHGVERSGTVSHYTDVDAVLSMLGHDGNEPGVLRMYNISYANDPQEGMALVKYAEDKHKGHPLVGFFSGLSGSKTGENMPFFGEHVYFVSFSEAKDRLDLWRFYGRDGAGACLVIPKEAFADPSQAHQIAGSFMDYRTKLRQGKLSDIPSKERQTQDRGRDPDPPLILWRVLYSPKAKDTALDSLCAPLENIAKVKSACSSIQNADKAIDEAVQVILAELLYLHKNTEYEREGELRVMAVRYLTSENVSGDRPAIQVDGRGRLYLETPRILFKTRGHEIVIGPKVAEYFEARLHLLYLLRKQKIPETYVTVSPSRVPYQP